MALLRDLPLSALRTFLVATRTLNLTRAAAELGVTAGAVSHQIRHLEELVGFKLILRTAHGIRISVAAEQVIKDLETGFEALTSAMDKLSYNSHPRPLTISADPSFASLWLAPRLERVRDALGGLNVRVVAAVPLDRLALEGVDLAISYLKGLAPGLLSSELFSERVIPACSPALAARLENLDTTAIEHLPLLHIDPAMGDDVYPSWDNWLAAAGKAGAAVIEGPRFGLTVAAAQAAASGGGIVLASEVVMQPFLSSGHLVEIARGGPKLKIARRFVWPAGGMRERQVTETIALLLAQS